MNDRFKVVTAADFDNEIAPQINEQEQPQAVSSEQIFPDIGTYAKPVASFVGRQAVNLPLRAGISAAAAPFETSKAIKGLTEASGGLLEQGYEALTGQKAPQFVGKIGEYAPYALLGKAGTALKFAVDILSKAPISTAELTDVAQKKLNVDLEPKNIFESIAYPTADAAPFLINPSGGWTQAAKQLGIAAAGKTTAQGLKALGYSKVTQALGDAATTTGLNLFGVWNQLRKDKQVFYDTEKALREGKTVESSSAKQALEKTRRTLENLPKEEAGKSTGANEAIRMIDEFATTGLQGTPDKANVDNFINYYRNLRNSYYSGNLKGPVKKAVGDLIQDLEKNTLDPFGKANPIWYKNFNTAQSLHAAEHEIGGLAGFLKDTINLNAFKNSNLMWKLIGASALGSHLGIPTAALVGTGAGLVGARELSKVAQSFFSNPHIRSAYISAMKAGLERNTPQLMRELFKLDKLLTKYQPNGSYDSERFQVVF